MSGMRGMQGMRPQEAGGRQENNRSMGNKGKAPSVAGNSGHGGAGAGQGKQGLRSLLESLAGEDFMVTVEFGKGEGDAGEA